MHATKQPYISAKLFRKRLLQYCWKGKKEKASVNERMNAKYHYTSKTKINSDRRKNVKFGNWLLCHWRDTLRLLCSWSSECSGLRLSSLDYQQSQHFLLKTAVKNKTRLITFCLSLPDQWQQTILTSLEFLLSSSTLRTCFFQSRHYGKFGPKVT